MKCVVVIHEHLTDRSAPAWRCQAWPSQAMVKSGLAKLDQAKPVQVRHLPNLAWPSLAWEAWPACGITSQSITLQLRKCLNMRPTEADISLSTCCTTISQSVIHIDKNTLISAKPKVSRAAYFTLLVCLMFEVAGCLVSLFVVFLVSLFVVVHF